MSRQPDIEINALGFIEARSGGEEIRLADGDKRLLAILVAAGPQGLGTGTAAHYYTATDGSNRVNTSSVETSPLRMAKSRLLRKVKHEIVDIAAGRIRLVANIDKVDYWSFTHKSADEIIAEGPAALSSFFERQLFPGLEPTELTVSAEQKLLEARSAVLRRLTIDETDGRLLLAINKRVQQDLIFRADDVDHTIHLLVSGGFLQEARHLATRCRDEWNEGDFGSPPHEVQRLLAHSSCGPPTDAIDLELSPIPAFLSRHLDKPMVGRSVTLEELLASVSGSNSGAVLTGAMGSGKTRLLAEAARELTSRGCPVVAFVGDSNVPAPLAQLRLTFPELRVEIDNLVSLLGDDIEEPTAANAELELLAAIERLGGQGACLIVDDGQWLDGASTRLLERIAASWVSKQWSLIVAGRPDPHAPGWLRFIGQLERSGMRRIEVGELSQTELGDLVGVMYPKSGSLTRYRCAAHLKRLGAALPALARRRLEMQDPAALLRSEVPKDREESVFAWAIDVTGDAANAGSAAAVLGYTFAITELAELLEITTEKALTLLGQLIEAGHLEEIDDPRFLRFTHDLARIAFMDHIPVGKRRELANRGAHLVASPIVRARLLVDALPLSSTSTTIQALEDVGLRAVADGSPDLAYAMFERANKLRVEPASANVVLQHAIAAELIGLDGTALRRQSFEEYLATADYAGALHAATAFELDLERFAADHERLDMLHKLESVALGREDLLRLRCSLARALGMSGNHAQAKQQIKLAQATARTQTERFAAWSAGWATICRLHPRDWPELDVDVAELTSTDVQCRYYQIDAIRRLVSGETAAASDSIRAAADAGQLGVTPIQQWHGMLIASTLSFVRGEWASASSQADAAFDLGQRQGIRNAAAVRGSQLFIEFWLARRYEALGAIMVTTPPEVQDSMLFQAGLGAALALSDGHHERGVQLATQATLAACEGQHPLSAAVAAIASEAIVGTERGTEKLRSVVTEELTRLEGANIVVGAGFAHLGPASHYLANASSDPAEKRARLQTAIEQADAAEQVVWQIALRAKLANLSADGELLREARALAASTELGDTLFAGQAG